MSKLSRLEVTGEIGTSRNVELVINIRRVHVSGIKGGPPSTTKATIFYKGGYQSQILLNATGYGTDQKWDLFETQMRNKLKLSGADKKLSILEFQRYFITYQTRRGS